MSWRGSADAEMFLYFFNGPALPKSIDIFDVRERARLHPVDVQRSVQVIDLVLQDACVPALRRNRDWFRSLVQTLHAHAGTATDDRRIALNTETSFEEVDTAFADERELRVDNHVEIDRRSLSHGKLFGSDVFDVFAPIFYDRELDRLTDLRSCKTYSRRSTHRVAHLDDQTLR